MIHALLHNGEHSCPCAWADGRALPSGNPEHREPAYTSLLDTKLGELSDQRKQENEMLEWGLGRWKGEIEGWADFMVVHILEFEIL